jgi:membrane associated rhomboid family serine protease
MIFPLSDDNSDRTTFPVVTVVLIAINVLVFVFLQGMWFVFQVISSLGVLGGMETGVAYGAHIGGFIAGAALVKLFMLGRTASAKDSWREQHRRDDRRNSWTGRGD